MTKFDVTVSSREVDATPEEQRVIYQSILDILREHRAYLLAPENLTEEQRAKLRELLEADDD